MGEQERFWAKVEKTETCWLWHGCRDRQGYGKLTLRNRGMLAHRVAYEWFVGPIPAGLQLDHLCRVPSCVRPSHLEAVTSRVNSLRGQSGSAVNARKTQCVNGHAFDAANTYIRPTGQRSCRSCIRDASRRYKHRKAGV